MRKETKLNVCYRNTYGKIDVKTFKTMRKTVEFIKQMDSANITRETMIVKSKRKVKVKITGRYVFRNGKIFKCFGNQFSYDVWNSL